MPVVVLKVGRSTAGARAAAAHSGALAGDQRVFRSLVEEAGAVWADDVHELLELAKTLAARRRSAPRPATRGARDHDLLRRRLGPGRRRGRSGSAWSCRRWRPPTRGAAGGAAAERRPPSANPLDYTAMIWGDVQALAELVRALGEDPAIGQVLVFYDQPHGMTGAPEESWRAVREGVMLGASAQPGAGDGVLDAARAARRRRRGEFAAAGVRRRRRAAHRAAMRRRALDAGAAADRARLREIAAAARAGRRRPRSAGGDWLAEHEAKELLRAAGVAVPDGPWPSTARTTRSRRGASSVARWR